MPTSTYFRNIVLTLLTCFTINIQGQTLTGIWTGNLTSSDSSQLGITLHIKAQNKNVVTGRSYLYVNQSELTTALNYKGALDFIGTIEGDSCRINELFIPDYIGAVDSLFLCRKIMGLKFDKKQTGYDLSGSYSAITSNNLNCPNGFITLRKFTGKQTPGYYLPLAVAQKISNDDISGIRFFRTRLTKPVVLKVQSQDIKLSVFDYLEKDNDTISIYYNRNKIVSGYRIDKKTLTKTLNLNKQSVLTEIVVFAENLGTIPPNTCTLVVDDGKTKQRVNILADMRYSPAIYLELDRR